MSRDILIFLLQRLGFVINQKKSVLQPTRQLEFLGMQIDTTNMCLFLTKEKLEKVTQKCWELYNHPKTNILELTRLIGLLSSTIQAVLPARIQVFTASTDTNAKSEKILPVCNHGQSGGKNGTIVMDRKSQDMEWQGNQSSGTANDDTDGCINPG